MSATLPPTMSDIPGAGSRCKGTNLFWIEQIKNATYVKKHKWRGGDIKGL